MLSFALCTLVNFRSSSCYSLIFCTCGFVRRTALATRLFSERVSNCFSCRNALSGTNVLNVAKLLWFISAALQSDAAIGQVVDRAEFCDDRSVPAAKAGVHHRTAYLLATQRHSPETA